MHTYVDMGQCCCCLHVMGYCERAEVLCAPPSSVCAAVSADVLTAVHSTKHMPHSVHIDNNWSYNQKQRQNQERST